MENGEWKETREARGWNEYRSVHYWAKGGGGGGGGVQPETPPSLQKVGGVSVLPVTVHQHYTGASGPLRPLRLWLYHFFGRVFGRV